ncbi:hypothetical protein HYPSUDRAFT_65907 [Hypholoma sublateritium FD-334 SS-4]|uniref:Uncharacterized protein n=1 Tax=Hypholoma sublateritium (strain FD-334 SS-4) TaxID=945553 RepID=A0A0D2MK80_HYPSF|nr:hypothetical protein HYPSUDRAFT_65907 [Hypholoma sublateritium FD-334 SS-4]
MQTTGDLVVFHLPSVLWPSGYWFTFSVAMLMLAQRKKDTYASLASSHLVLKKYPFTGSLCGRR